MFGGHWSSASGDIKYLTCHVTLQNHVIEGSSNFYKWPSLVAIGIVIVEINVFSLSRDQARLHNWMVLKEEPLKENNHPNKFSDHRYCGIEDTVLLIFRVFYKNTWLKDQVTL